MAVHCKRHRSQPGWHLTWQHFRQPCTRRSPSLVSCRVRTGWVQFARQCGRSHGDTVNDWRMVPRTCQSSRVRVIA